MVSVAVCVRLRAKQRRAGEKKERRKKKKKEREEKEEKKKKFDFFFEILETWLRLKENKFFRFFSLKILIF